MRKFFIFISVLILAATASAAETTIGPNDSDVTVKNKLSEAVSGASSNDVIELSDGIYEEDGGFYITKNLTIRAAENAHPVIAQKYAILVKNSAQVTFNGIKFDGGLYPEWVQNEKVYHAADHCIRPYDSNGEETLTLIDCEFIHYPNYIIYTQRDVRRCDAITIQNCYFHDNTRSAVYITAEGDHQTCNSLTIENTTFADFTGNYPIIYYDAPNGEHTTTLNINHCTFYKHPYPAINLQKSSTINITNCIFAQPSSLNRYSIVCQEGTTIDHCLAYNTSGYSGASSTNDLTGNPYFLNTNPENYDFTVWTTSPAHNAGTDGYDLGDYTRWNTDPSTHVATVNITADEDNSLKAAIDAALPGDEIILAAGTYEESESISLDKEITLKAADGASPVVKPVGNFAISNAANITIQNIKFDGTSHTATNFIYAADDTNNSLSIEGCDFYSFSHPVIYAESNKLLGACSVNNCYFYNNTNSCVYLKNTTDADLTVTNSTFANNATSTVGTIETRTQSGDIRVDHCTFYNCTVQSTDYGCVGNRDGASTNVIVSNCIFAMPSDYSSGRAIRLCDGNTINNCLTYNYSSSTNGIRGGSTVTNHTISNPLFNDLANNNYTYDANWSTGSISPALGSATDGSNLGDPRWDRDNEVLPSSSIASSYDLLSTKAQLTGDVELNASNHIKYKGTSTPGTVKWKLHVERACMINALVDREEGNDSGCKLTLTAYDADGSEVGALVASSANYNTDFYLPGTITFSEAGDYTFILTNSTANSGAILEKITLSYVGGAVQEISTSVNTTLNVEDAWFSAGGTRANGKIDFPNGSIQDGWIRWNVNVPETKYFDVTVNIASSNGHNYGVRIFNDDRSIELSEGGQTSAASPRELGRVNIPAGDYTIEVTNSIQNSDAELISVLFVPVVATSTALPNTLAFSNAVLSEKAHITNGMLYFNEIGDSNPQGQWAQWEVTTDHNGLFLFTMNVTSENEQSYKITIKDDSENELDFYETSPGSGAKEIKHYFALATGTYFVKVENTRSYSKGHLVSFVVTEPAGVVTIDESATINTSWADKVVDKNAEGPLYDVQIIRTIKAGMYNTFCLPFEVSSSQCKDIFGSDVQIRTLGSATIEEGDFVLNLNFDVASDIYPGTPVLIKTSRDIVNPVFTGVKFTIAAPSATTKTNANYTGTFVKSTLPADENILFLGANNKLFFPTAEVDILGMRGWFVIHGSGGAAAPAIRGARIVENNQVATYLDLVNETDKQSLKTIENGRLVIIRDGVRYNAQGQLIRK